MKPSRVWFSSAATLIVLGFAAGCASVPGLTEVQAGDFDALRKTTLEEDYSPRQVRYLAEAILDHEVRHAKDRGDREFIASLTPCRTHLLKALRNRSKEQDGVAAEARLQLLEAGQSHGSVGKYAAAEDGAWRSLHARSTKDDGPARREYFVDKDERVRRAALLAAMEAADTDDVQGLLDVARLDPDPLSRSRAITVLGRISAANTADRLQDLYGSAAVADRLAIVDAWSQSGVLEQGGREMLLALVRKETGLPSVVAAQRLSGDSSPEVRNPALVRLVRFAKEGTTDERRLSLQIMPLSHEETSQALLEATETQDRQVQVIAWSRLLAHDAHRRRAEKALLALSTAESGVEFQARAALSASGSSKVAEFLQAQSLSKDATTRAVAAKGLLRLGYWDDVATLLADADPQNRRSLACATLARPLTPKLD